MRKTYEMASNNVKVWQDGMDNIVLEVYGEETTLSDIEVKDLIKTLDALVSGDEQ